MHAFRDTPAAKLACRLIVVLIAGAAGLGSTAAAAHATAGALTQPAGVGACISEDGTGGQCAVGHGLNDSAAVAVSPDGRNVYVVSTQGQSIATFARDSGSGALTETSCLGAQPPTATDPCAQVPAGLESPDAVTVSGDGRSVYVANSVGELTVFARDPSSGTLSQPAGQECIESVGADCPANGMALLGAAGVVVSPDAGGQNVYVTSANDQAVAEFGRDAATSRLTQPSGHAACVSRNGVATSATGSAADCLITQDGFKQPLSVAISSDGTDLFTTDRAAHALWDLGRNPATGTLAEPGCYGPADCTLVHGLDDARGVAVSPDGRAVFVVSATPGSIAVLSRAVDGSLSQPAQSPGPGALYDCFTNNGAEGCVQGRALAGARAVVVSPDGTNVYVSAVDSGAIAAFARNPVTNQLAQLAGSEGCLSYNGSGGLCTSGRLLEGLVSIAASPDGRNLYGVSSNHSAVLIINREPPATPVSSGSAPGSPAPGAGSPPSPGPAVGVPPTATPGVGRPLVGGFSIQIQRRRGRRPVRGTLRFRLSRNATVRVSVWRIRASVRPAARCAKRPALRPPEACRSLVFAGSLSRAARAGRTTVSFTTRLGTARLRPGRYVASLVATATGSGGLASPSVTTQFSIRPH